jgi:ubiquinone/menaquinone biosynthesis C-methylase UbiE
LHIGGINFFSDKKKAIEEMIRVARPKGKIVIADESERVAQLKIVIADESERVAQLVARLLRLSRFNHGKKVDTSMPIHLVPATMEEIRADGIWKRHGQLHGYCLGFRKPAG